MKKTDVAKYLGVSLRGLETLIKEGGIPYRNAGRFYLFSRDAIDRWLEGSNERD